MTQIEHRTVVSLAPERLRAACDPAQFHFVTTAQLADPQAPFAHERAIEAVRLALDTNGRGYNIFVLGRPGSGRHAIVRSLLESWARGRPAPPDRCYIHNFADPHKPRVLTLPAGQGTLLRAAMQQFIVELRKAIQAAFEGDEYRSRIDAIQRDYKRREEEQLRSLADDAAAHGVMLLHTPQGFAFAPMRNGEALEPQQFQSLPADERGRIEAAIDALGQRVARWMNELPRQRREMYNRIRDASRETMGLAAGHLVEELKAAFAAHPQVIGFLGDVHEDIVHSAEGMQEQASEDEDAAAEVSGTLSLSRYQVNLLVDHAAATHAPVIDCDNPAHATLIGRVDHVAHLGTLLTNFTMIKPGALHRANGGCLMLDAVQVLSQPYSWNALKRALKGGSVAIESLPEAMGLGSASLLEPEPVELAVKVALFGEREHYYLLQALDPEFAELFRIAADFEDDVPRDAGNVAAFAQLVGAMARERKLRPCDPSGVARLVEHAARLAGDARRLSTRTQRIEELLHEADTFAARGGRDVIGRDDIQSALAARERRADRLRDTLRDATLRESLHIATAGAHAGQVNGLAVADLGEFMFGHPLRVTALAHIGEGKVIDIERESSLGRPIHSKGVLILSSFIAGRWGRNAPLAFSASLVFEQSYGPVEGDSASLAELCALLSALAGLPMRQSLAVTGSVDQFGQVQAVGGVNEKVEGFFDLCRARGLDGAQGVLIPATNAQHLMLREDVVEAVREGRFHVHAVSDADEALALLSGIPAGTADAAGHWPAGSFNRLVADRLHQLSTIRPMIAIGTPLRAHKARHGGVRGDGPAHE